QVLWDARLCAFHNLREQFNTRLTDRIGFIRKWIEWASWMSSSLKQHACKLVIRFHGVDLQSHHSKQACFQCLFFFEGRHGDREVIFVKALIESLDQIFL